MDAMDSMNSFSSMDCMASMQSMDSMFSKDSHGSMHVMASMDSDAPWTMDAPLIYHPNPSKIPWLPWTPCFPWLHTDPDPNTLPPKTSRSVPRSWHPNTYTPIRIPMPLARPSFLSKPKICRFTEAIASEQQCIVHNTMTT